MATRPLPLTFADREAIFSPEKGVASPGVPGEAEWLGAFGVGVAATTESSD
jgi:hypothetical protein